MEFNDAILKIRDVLNDTESLRWSDAELGLYINEAQRRYALVSKEFIATSTITATATSIINMPVDFISFVRFVDINNKDIPCLSWIDLNYNYNPLFISDTDGDLLAVCFDYESWNKMRTYPNKTSGIIGTLTYSRFPADNTIEAKYTLPLIYYATAKAYLRDGTEYVTKAFEYLAKFNNELFGNINYEKNLRYIGNPVYGETF